MEGQDRKGAGGCGEMGVGEEGGGGSWGVFPFCELALVNCHGPMAFKRICCSRNTPTPCIRKQAFPAVYMQCKTTLVHCGFKFVTMW